MHVRYHVEELEKMIEHLIHLLGISIVVFDRDMHVLACKSAKDDYCSALQESLGLQEVCHRSDYEIVQRCKESMKTEHHMCHAGLCDVAVPIVKNDVALAFVVLGRIRLASSPPKPVYDLGDNDKNARYDKTKCFTDLELESLMHLLPYIVFDTAISLEEDTVVDHIARYAKEHLTEELTVQALSKRFCLSKAALYKAFSQELGTTVNEFVTSVRMERARELLLTTDWLVIEVAEAVGITNYTYFCKLFKKLHGVSPKNWRTEAKYKKNMAT